MAQEMNEELGRVLRERGLIGDALDNVERKTKVKREQLVLVCGGEASVFVLKLLEPYIRDLETHALNDKRQQSLLSHVDSEQNVERRWKAPWCSGIKKAVPRATTSASTDHPSGQRMSSPAQRDSASAAGD
ncbi:hypothetical protein HPB50_018878 [Hyalomma asiaticum]|uniref:Uncharacterized protein n=1 Tax=Hyalomma asiaticum TaxID=266040 RepID=A0ACB7TKI2_HYAAI|nr:hypothetical protein HPB50_018878 [Hyalomma asiaticum]